MKLALLHSDKAYLPELYAYRSYLVAKGYAVSIETEREARAAGIPPDVYYRFAGFLRHRVSHNVPEIHEYASASIGRFPRVKNLVKSLVSAQPAGRVFLNEDVKHQFHFPVSTMFMYRDMGADQAFFEQRGQTAKTYDLVYAGSITGRPGVLDCICRLAENGLHIGLAGTVTAEEIDIIKVQKNIEYVGRLPIEQVPAFVGSARFGLNYCPDIYPYNLQTSTKVIEYLAAGIGIVSNNYSWISRHATKHGYSYLDVNSISCPDSLLSTPSAILDIKDARQFEWTTLLDRAGLDAFIRRCIDPSNAGNAA